ncbi:polyprenyl synthetase family protein [Micromonospora sp. FIMYZ51]|uniref:polyprenyl synthetase family protein n=1 Tax=Micromonospora sp. FIMYZ51 TaxID=3051832 RepID=UPI00311FF403
MTLAAPIDTAPPLHELPGVAQARRWLPALLRQQIATLAGPLEVACGYQLGLLDADGSPRPKPGGKLFRPALALLCAAAVGGQQRDALVPAAAIELMHNATLVHDDVMDGDRERRHRLTVWAQFGVPTAVLVGDALLALGFGMLSVDENPAAPAAVADLAETLRVLALGQEQDLTFEGHGEVSLAACLTMMERKTGALLGCACNLGARYGGADPEWAARFAGFGSQLGLALQIMDDVLGIWGDPAVTGKPVGADLRRRKKSAPVVYALGGGTPAAAELAEIYRRPAPAQPGPAGDDEITELRRLLTEAGARTWAVRETERRLAAAWAYLDGLDLDPAGTAALRVLADRLMARTW